MRLIIPLALLGLAFAQSSPDVWHDSTPYKPQLPPPVPPEDAIAPVQAVSPPIYKRNHLVQKRCVQYDVRKQPLPKDTYTKLDDMTYMIGCQRWGHGNDRTRVVSTDFLVLSWHV
jgi:hypothetical protein